MRSKDVLDGRFELVTRIGVGGMGSVWEARELSTGRRVAIKALHEHLIRETEIVTRFLREAQAALESRYSGHIIEVYDVVHPADRAPYIVMEFLEGEDLEQILEREGALEPRRAVDLVIQTCEAVAEVHRQGFIHRDIKPENLFVTRLPDGTEWIKLLDFGVVKFSDSSAEKERPLTDFGRTVGTVWYMAPEQAANPTGIDHRVDIYAVGVVLYELLTAEVPFDSEDQRELMRMLYKGGPTPIRKHRPELSAALEKVVDRAMAVNPRKRFQTMYEFAEALQPFGSAPHAVNTGDILAGKIKPLPTPGILDSILKTRGSETIEIDRRPVRRRLQLPRLPLIAGTVGVVILAVVLGITFGAMRSCGSEGPAEKDEAVVPILVKSRDAGGDGDEGDGSGEGEALDDEEVQRRWAARYGHRLDKQAVARGLRSFGPSIRKCLKGTRAPGTRVLIHFWIARNGTVQYRRARPSLPRSAQACIRRVVRSKRLEPTKVPAFVATHTYVVPR